MKKNRIKMALDIVMIIILILLYNSHVAVMIFHELAGLIVCGLFILHCLLNKKWIVTITKKFLSKSLPFKTRLGYIINLLLLITFTLIVISGICTSQALFRNDSQGSVWRGIHHCAAAISIILVGIHIGLHWSFIVGMCKRIPLIQKKASSKLNVIVVIAIFTFGSYSMVTGSLGSWLTEPFVTQVKLEEQSTHVSDDSSDDASEENVNTKDEDTEKTVETTPILVVNTMTTYLSIISVFTIITYYLDKLVLKRRKRKYP